MFSRPEFSRERQGVAGGLNFHAATQSFFGNGFFDTPFVFHHFGSNRIFCLPGRYFFCDGPGLRAGSSRWIIRLRRSLSLGGACRRIVWIGF